jgi:hypothetical protein
METAVRRWRMLAARSLTHTEPTQRRIPCLFSVLYVMTSVTAAAWEKIVMMTDKFRIEKYVKWNRLS